MEEGGLQRYLRFRMGANFSLYQLLFSLDNKCKWFIQQLFSANLAIVENIAGSL